MYELGIIGGMGPLATVEAYKRIIEKTKAEKDQDHIPIIVLNNTFIPDRTEAILDGGDSPTNSLNDSIATLEKVGVKRFIIPCNTAHYFATDLIYDSKIKFINMIDETLLEVARKEKDLPVYILGTLGTIKTNIYKNSKYSKSLNIVYPSKEYQKNIMNLIYKIKTDSDLVSAGVELNNILNYLDEAIFVLACTELSLLNKYIDNNFIIVDALDVLIERAIIDCGYELKGSN